MAILNLIDKITDDIDNKNCWYFYRFVNKKFDTIDHDILLDKLSFYMYGVRGIAKKCFYVIYEIVSSICKYRVRNPTYSLSNLVVRGVLLRPSLFLLYANDMVTLSSITNFIMFADYTNLFLSGNDVDPLAKSVNFELEKITGH